MRRMIVTRAWSQGEQGAVATIFALLVATGVITGMLALTVDVGGIMFERRQLQNGADAAAMSLAKICSTKPLPASCASGTAASAAVEGIAGQNSADGAQSVPVADGTTPLVCGHNAGTLPECTLTANASDLASCIPKSSGLSATTSYVEVRTRTLTSNGGTILPSAFSQAITGSSGPTVTACARAAWGPLGSNGGSVPVVFGRCNWEQATGTLTPPFAPEPAYSPPPSATSPPAIPSNVAAYAVPIFGKLNGSEANDALVQKFGCKGDLGAPSGAYTPGGFGWVDTTATGCTAFISDGDTLSAYTGGLPNNCANGVLKSYVGTEVPIPIISTVTLSGTNATYKVDGISYFFLAGYYNIATADGPQKDWNVYAGGPCSGYKSECLWGWFTSPLLPVGSLGGGGTPRGPTVISPAG